MQGRLRKESLSVAIATECAHCAKPIHLEIDSELRYRVVEEAAEPVISVPFVDFARLTSRERSSPATESLDRNIAGGGNARFVTVAGREPQGAASPV